jgi:hypothetical protein
LPGTWRGTNEDELAAEERRAATGGEAFRVFRVLDLTIRMGLK